LRQFHGISTANAIDPQRLAAPAGRPDGRQRGTRLT
jgi:hypothetical protein